MQKVIEFEEPTTWLHIAEESLDLPETYVQRLSTAGTMISHWDCSGLNNVISDSELQNILKNISKKLGGYSLRLYHGCRLYNRDDPKVTGLKASSTSGIEQSFIELAQNDEVLVKHLDKIKSEINDKFAQRQAQSRDRQIWFCIRYKEMIEEGGVYCVFGSEYRLLILNSINPKLKDRLLYYGRPAIVSLNVPIIPYLEYFTQEISKYLFDLWIQHKLKLEVTNFPSGFACWINQDIPGGLVNEVLMPDKVYDQYNDDSRWYTWAEMALEEQRT
jgi:hypothetical protein